MCSIKCGKICHTLSFHSIWALQNWCYCTAKQKLYFQEFFRWRSYQSTGRLNTVIPVPWVHLRQLRLPLSNECFRPIHVTPVRWLLDASSDALLPPPSCLNKLLWETGLHSCSRISVYNIEDTSGHYFCSLQALSAQSDSVFWPHQIWAWFL